MGQIACGMALTNQELLLNPDLKGGFEFCSHRDSMPSRVPMLVHGMASIFPLFCGVSSLEIRNASDLGRSLLNLLRELKSLSWIRDVDLISIKALGMPGRSTMRSISASSLVRKIKTMKIFSGVVSESEQFDDNKVFKGIAISVRSFCVLSG